MREFSQRFRFADWPNPAVPLATAGNYAIWSGEQLIYCGMAGRQFDPAKADGKRPYGLYTRLASHASGRLSGDQFCVYVANRLVLPELEGKVLPRFASGELTLDALTRQYIHARLEYQFVCVESSHEAFALERECRRGVTFGAKPTLNPA